MTVAVVMSTYRRADLLLNRSLASVFRQTVKPDEIIVVGDGTDDETVRVMESLAGCACHRLRFWNLPHQKYPEDEGQRWCVAGLEARNFGLSQVRSEWVCTLDDDDEYTDDHIEVLLNAVTSGPYDFAYGMSNSYWPDAHHQLYGSLPLQHFNACDGSWILRANLGYRYDPACIERGLPEDGDLLDRIVADGRRWTFVPKIIHGYYPSQHNY
jgi:O-antigen biosynthesis protein